MNPIEIGYIPCPDVDTAKSLARMLLEKRLIACANILPQMTSLYQWQGQIEESNEVVLIIKSLADRFQEIDTLVAENHPYDCPCLITWQADQCHNPFRKWLTQELGSLT